ncbi:hypothetical protein Cfor_00830 [Coptotermes formosanus]|uniref:Uncharacterized protein n=1 Tax=Coptotermes formosanus TaxID=36987 RepID=A0A6L2PYG0_COPFO|nr:hypothetical protein Cfor_00830 [Coptotermes formosanus]
MLHPDDYIFREDRRFTTRQLALNILISKGRASLIILGIGYSKKKLKIFPSAGKVMITVFGDCEGVILVDLMPKGETVNADASIRMLTEIRKRFEQVRSHKIPM